MLKNKRCLPRRGQTHTSMAVHLPKLSATTSQQFTSRIHKRYFFPGLNDLGFSSLWFTLFFLLAISYWLTLHGSTRDCCSQLTLYLQSKYLKKSPKACRFLPGTQRDPEQHQNIPRLTISNIWAPEALSRPGCPSTNAPSDNPPSRAVGQRACCATPNSHAAMEPAEMALSKHTSLFRLEIETGHSPWAPGSVLLLKTWGRRSLLPSLPSELPNSGSLSSHRRPVKGGASTVSPTLQVRKGWQEQDGCLCREGTHTGNTGTTHTGTHMHTFTQVTHRHRGSTHR